MVADHVVQGGRADADGAGEVGVLVGTRDSDRGSRNRA